MASGPALVYADLSFPLHRVRNTIGRRNLATGIVPTVDLTPLDRDRVVSRRHAEIVHRDGSFFIVDTQARNGVYVNGDRLPPSGERQLCESDSVSFGGVSLTFFYGAAWPDGLTPEWERAEDPFGGFDAVSDVTTTSAGTLSGQLHDALEKQQFVLQYQPKVNLATGRLEAAEALLRWHHPVMGVVPPDRFLPLAESTGFIKAITTWVVEAALKQLSDWHSQGLNLKMAVNISTRDLEDDRLAERVATLLRQTGVPAQDLIIEMTETGLMNDPKRSIRNLAILKETRVRLSIDDFGIGQSSLAYLKQLPADELKIDKSFSMSIDANNLAILRSAINVGHDLGMRVTAEGVETESAMAALRELGCDLGQGYHFGKPVAADTLADSPLARTAIDSTAPGWVLGRKHH